jgi:hypothetical protein
MSKSIILALSISLFSGCSEPEPTDHYYQVGKAHRNAGPYWETEMTIPNPTGGETSAYVYSSISSDDLRDVVNRVNKVSKFVSKEVTAMGVSEQCSNETIINIYSVTSDKINDPKVMTFLPSDSELPDGVFYYGLTTFAWPFPIGYTFVCSDCVKGEKDETMVHELAHFWLMLCGHGEDRASHDIPEMLEEVYMTTIEE